MPTKAFFSSTLTNRIIITQVDEDDDEVEKEEEKKKKKQKTRVKKLRKRVSRLKNERTTPHGVRSRVTC